MDPRTRRRMVPAPLRARAARSELGPSGRPPGTRGHPAVLVRARGGGRAHRLGGAARQGPRAARLRRGPSIRTRSSTATSCTTSTAPGGVSPTRTAVSSSARSGCRTPNASPAICAPTSCTPPSTSPSSSCPWDAAALRTAIDDTLAEHAPSAPPPPGCCATTTSPARSPATAARTPASTSPRRVRHPHRPGSRHPSRPCRRAALAGPARLGLRLPGRGTRLARGRDPTREHPGPDAPPLRRHRPGPGRLPGAAALAGRRPVRGLRRARRAMAAAARRTGPRTPPTGRPADPDSMLSLYRAALRIRRGGPGFGDGPLRWLPAAPGVLSFARTDGLVCVVNLAGQPAELPEHCDVLLDERPCGRRGPPAAGHRGLAAGLTRTRPPYQHLLSPLPFSWPRNGAPGPRVRYGCVPPVEVDDLGGVAAGLRGTA